METITSQQEYTMNPEPQPEHHWLRKLVGDWTYESEANMGPEQPSEKATGTEQVRSLGELWVQCEGQGEMCGSLATTVLTLGYDPQKKRYVGTWIGSMMAHLWLYEGELEIEKQVLTLNSEGPSMDGTAERAQYKDVIEFMNNDHRVMTSHVLGDDGQWHHFMTAHYRRSEN